MAVIILCLPFTACDSNDADIDIEGVSLSDTETDYVMIKVKKYGDIIIKLCPEVAPETVANFKKLVSEKFYDGIIFHRVIEGFMIQGGDPDGNGMGGSPDTIKGEFSANGYANNLKHVRGVVSMARLGHDNNSASSQFFIMHVDYPYLDGNYAAFGYVIHGMDVVDAIAEVRTDSNDKPITDVVMESVRFVKVDDTKYTVSTDNMFDTDRGEVETHAPHNAPALDALDLSELTDLSAVTESDSPTDYVMITVKDHGVIVLRLFPDVAPRTVENFKKLVSENFYDGIIFHRIIEDFMIQGGDPDGDGTGGSPDTIIGEFESNGFKNNLPHIRGVVSMARTSDPNSASSQFFIMHKTSAHLDGEYASFGYVVYGMDTVDSIASVTTGSSDRPLNDVVMTSVRFVNVNTEIETDTKTNT